MTLKEAAEAFTGRKIESFSNFLHDTPEILKLEFTLSDNKGIISTILNKDDIQYRINKENDPYSLIICKLPYVYYIDYNSQIIECESLYPDGKIDSYTIDDIKCFNRSMLSIDELMEYFKNMGHANVFEDTNNFQIKFGLKERTEKNTTPAFLDDDKMTMKIGHLKEELAEIERAYKDRDIVEVADGIMDLIYVAAGLANLMNLPCDVLWHDVQNANMAYKERVTSLDNATKRGSTFDVRKSKNWIAPRGKEIIEN